MDFNEEDSILPILNQVKAFQHKWLAKNQQCETLESFYRELEATNKELKATNTEMKASLNSIVAKNKELKSANAELKSSLREKTTETEELQSKCESLKSSLEAANVECEQLRVIRGTTVSNFLSANGKVKDLNVKCKSLKSSLDAANAKYELLQKTHETTESSLVSANLRIRELDSKCTTLETLLHKVDYENKDLKKKMDKLKTRRLEEKKKVVKITLERVQDKLLKSPLHVMIDRVKHNIEALDENARTSVSVPSKKDIEVVDILSSDSGDESTLSLNSENQNIDDLLSPCRVKNKTEPSEPSEQGNSNETTEPNSASSSVPVEPALPYTIEPCVELTNRNSNRVNRVEIDDDMNYDSDISLSICDDVTSTTAEEENLDESSGKLTTSTSPSSSNEFSSSTCNPITISSQISPAKVPEPETNVQQSSDPVISHASHDENNIEQNNVESSNVIPNAEPNTNQGPECSNLIYVISEVPMDISMKAPEISSVSVGELETTLSNPSQSSDSNNEALSNATQSPDSNNDEAVSIEIPSPDSNNEAVSNENETQSRNNSDQDNIEDQVDAIVSKLLKSGNHLKVMHRVVITPVQEENYERVGVEVGVPNGSSHSSLPSIAESTLEDSSSMKRSPDQKRHIIPSKLKCCS
ncbi:uncharacterized protein DDB_G0287625-like [Planococcus citri]|uniref:uncharacterized protein DDB_G0287625-like n=1 Tax=Planococcus citri TaxID=170843 RepID=UPI0031F764E7